ncbi:hypothetical protein QBC44DRAFT_245552 [Cladorrhinum sp. PSN332]|nr:hypothetical protein QBC44DRAFT_245552 [Cladorrhinum sp. PSN332]
MDDSDQAWELALKAAQELAVVAIQLARKKAAGGLGPQKTGRLLLVNNLGSFTRCLQTISLGCQKSESRAQDLGQFLESLERICTWPRTVAPLQYPTLQDLTSKELATNGMLTAKIEASILSFFQSDSKIFKRFLSFLKRFSNMVSDDGLTGTPKTGAGRIPVDHSTLAVPDEDPPHVQSTLYEVLTKFVLLECSCPGCHEIRLRLTEVTLQADKDVLFDAVFSRRPADCTVCHEVEWQHVQFHVSRKQARKRTVGFAKEQDERCSDVDIIKTSPFYGPPVNHADDFCHVIKAMLGRVKIRLKVVNEPQSLSLLRFEDLEGVDHDIAQKQSISLAELLRERHLTSKKKLILAYIVANSFWRFYGSDWISCRWTPDSIQFFERREGDRISGTLCLEDSPYFALGPGRQKTLPVDEILPPGDFIHRYPWVLALGCILLELGRPETTTPTEYRFTSPAEINNCFVRIQSALKSKNRLGFNLQDEEIQEVYTTVVNNCTDRQIFQEASTIEERRAKIYQKIVVPLRRLLERLRWVDESGRVRKQDQPEPEPDQRTTQGTATLLNTTEAATVTPKSELWLRKIQDSEVSRTLCTAFKEKKTLDRIRVAVLDTGYDGTSIFFKSPDRKHRIRGWKDYVNCNSNLRSDTDGHGTHVLSLVMKVAPAADIYVARVAGDTADLAGSTNNISEAILWAAKECQADIISMSFGFDEEIFVNDEPVISNAISEALRIRNQRILFLAAAANEGGNQPEMFPAKHPYVISMRGTDDKGWLQRFNPPPDYAGVSCFMTLGQDVPGAALNRHGGGEVCKSGTSVSTPIAAGIAAMLLGYARVHESELKQKFRPGEAWKSSQLWTMSGMRKLFRMLSTEMLDRWSYLSAQKFLGETHELRICMLALTISGGNSM